MGIANYEKTIPANPYLELIITTGLAGDMGDTFLAYII